MLRPCVEPWTCCQPPRPFCVPPGLLVTSAASSQPGAAGAVLAHVDRQGVAVVGNVLLLDVARTSTRGRGSQQRARGTTRRTVRGLSMEIIGRPTVLPNVPRTRAIRKVVGDDFGGVPICGRLPGRDARRGDRRRRELPLASARLGRKQGRRKTKRQRRQRLRTGPGAPRGVPGLNRPPPRLDFAGGSIPASARIKKNGS